MVFEDGKILFFKNTPLSLLKDYEKLFKKTPNVIFLAQDASQRVYSSRWAIKGKELYLEKFFTQKYDSINDFDENHKETERFTKSKFDGEGKMKAYWVTRKLPLFGVRPFFNGNGNWAPEDRKKMQNMHLDSLQNYQSYYLAKFKNGKLLKIEDTDSRWNSLK